MITNAALAQKVNDVIAAFELLQDEQQAWMNGIVGGGPSMDGRFPITDFQGNIVLATSPLQLEQDVDDLVTGVAANSSAAIAAQAAAETARDTANTHRSNAVIAETSSISAKDTATLRAAEAATDAATALAQAGNAVTSAAAAAADAVLTAADAVLTAADRVQTGIDAAAAAASAATAAGFDPALFATLTGATFTGPVVAPSFVNVGGPALFGDANNNSEILSSNNVRLKISGNTKLLALSTGVNVTGALAATGAVTGSNLNVANWDTTFGFGDHAAAGYATGVNDLTMSNDKDIKFLTNLGADDGTKIFRPAGNALRIDFTANSFIIRALADNDMILRGAADTDKINFKMGTGDIITVGKVQAVTGRFGNGSTAAPGMSFTNEPNTGLMRAIQGRVDHVVQGVVSHRYSNTLFEMLKDVTVSGDFIANGAVNAIAGTTLNVSPSGNINISAASTQILSGKAFRVFDATNLDSIKVTHTGTDVSFDHINTVDWNISSLTGAVWIRDGARLRISDGTDIDTAEFWHNGTDFKTVFANTAEWDINTLSAINYFSNQANATFRVGRSINEHFKIFFDDGKTVLTSLQDETDATAHDFLFNIDSGNTGSRTYKWQNDGVNLMTLNKVGVLDITGQPKKSGLAIPYYITSGYTSGKISVSATTPTSPAKGDQWFDTS